MSKTFVTLSTKKGTLQQKIARAEAGREEISAAGWDALVGWRDPAKRPPREKTQLKIGTESAAGWLLSFCPIQCHTALARSKGPPETPRGGAGWGEQSHTACCERERAGSYFNRNTDLRKEERLKNGMPTPLLKSNDCKYCLSRPRRQADHMHHVETFTKSVKFFSSTISWGFSALWSFPPKECTFCRTSQAYYFSNSPLDPPSPKYSSSFSLTINFPLSLTSSEAPGCSSPPLSSLSCHLNALILFSLE